MLRSNFTPGTTRWAVRRAQWRSLGIREEDMLKPKIAVINSSSALSSCYAHLDQLSHLVQEAIISAGGLPFEIHTIAPSDFVTSAGKSARYLMPSRDLLANDIEVMVEGAQLDGMVCLSSCDKTTPAHLMAAGRLNIPTVLVIGGYQVGGVCAGKYTDIDDVYEAVGAVTSGSLSIEQLQQMTEVAISCPGVCAGLGTANTMHIVAEALGMTVAGSAPVRAESAKMRAKANEAGRRIVSMVLEDLRPRQIITKKAICNAIITVLAMAGSVNAVRHLAAIATEAGIDIDVVHEFERYSKQIPLLCTIRPNGPHQVYDLERSGGAQSLLAALRPLLFEETLTISGKTLGEVLDQVSEPDGQIIHPLTQPVSPEGGIHILRGSLAPDGAIVKTSAIPVGIRQFCGPARIFGGEEEAMQALAEKRIEDGDVVVLRGLGPRGGPGTGFAAGFVAALVGAGRSQHVAVVTDGELSGLNRGITIGQVMPEAAEGGPLGIVRDGDMISIDLDSCCLDLVLEPAEIARRLQEEPFVLCDVESGWLAIYRQVVQPIARGATLGRRKTSATPSISQNGYTDPFASTHG